MAYPNHQHQQSRAVRPTLYSNPFYYPAQNAVSTGEVGNLLDELSNQVANKVYEKLMQKQQPSQMTPQPANYAMSYTASAPYQHCSTPAGFSQDKRSFDPGQPSLQLQHPYSVPRYVHPPSVARFNSAPERQDVQACHYSGKTEASYPTIPSDSFESTSETPNTSTVESQSVPSEFDYESNAGPTEQPNRVLVPVMIGPYGHCQRLPYSRFCMQSAVARCPGPYYYNYYQQIPQQAQAYQMRQWGSMPSLNRLRKDGGT